MTDIELRWYYANDWQAPVLQYRRLPDTTWHEVPSASRKNNEKDSDD